MLTEKIGPLRAHVTGGTDGNGAGDGATVVLLHGFGAPGTDLVGLAQNLRARPHTRFVFPEAPEVADVGMPPPYEGRAWWHIDMLNLQLAVFGRNWDELAAHVPEGLAEARAKLNDFLDALELRLGTGAAPLVLGGFSQGAMLSADVVLHSERRFDGLLLFSGSLIARTDWLTRIAQRAPVPVLQSHGRQDPVLPFPVAEQLHRAFTAHDWPVKWVPFDGGHGIGAEALRAANDFLAQVLA
jgi:phospholipase/carboxylesterase